MLHEPLSKRILGGYRLSIILHLAYHYYFIPYILCISCLLFFLDAPFIFSRDYEGEKCKIFLPFNGSREDYNLHEYGHSLGSVKLAASYYDDFESSIQSRPNFHYNKSLPY